MRRHGPLTNAQTTRDLPRRHVPGRHLQHSRSRRVSRGSMGRGLALPSAMSAPSRPGRREERPRPGRPGGSSGRTRRNRRPCPGTHRLPRSAHARWSRHRPRPPTPGSWRAGSALVGSRSATANRALPGDPAPRGRPTGSRRIRFMAPRHSVAEAASAGTCRSGWSPISIPRPARTTASGSTTTTPSRGRACSRLLALEGPADSAISPMCRWFPPPTCAGRSLLSRRVPDAALLGRPAYDCSPVGRGTPEPSWNPSPPGRHCRPSV